MRWDVKLHTVQQIHGPLVNQLTSSYFCLVIGYDLLASFSALIYKYTYVIIIINNYDYKYV